MVVLVAHFWNILPHQLWAYPLRYYRELRGAYLESVRPPKRTEEDSLEWGSDKAREKVTEFRSELHRSDEPVG